MPEPKSNIYKKMRLLSNSFDWQSWELTPADRSSAAPRLFKLQLSTVDRNVAFFGSRDVDGLRGTGPQSSGITKA
ncbi:hypothetical protein RRG08_015564 [Elysia crispata]|uniref:Uncharacterized protein n=1 Tax=Elysia crispata TaxID=231223 RepID=A0AAE0YJR7_9GAST|nr:hypothetical protein RRG08_015564 [Elysia crispata]